MEAVRSLGGPAPAGVLRPVVLSFVFNGVLCSLKGGELLEALCRSRQKRGSQVAWLGATEVRTGANRLRLTIGPHQASLPLHSYASL